jgi:hypothetical protein
MDENVQQPAEMSERETLLYKLFKRRLFRTSQEPEKQRVLVGQIPTDLSEEVPLPEGSRVLGTIIDWQHVSIVFEAILSPDAVISFYKEQLPETGWQEREQLLIAVLRERGMSVPPVETSSCMENTGYKRQGFLRTTHGPSLTVTAEAGSEDGTQIEIELDLTSYDYMPPHSENLLSEVHLRHPGDGEDSSGSLTMSDYDAHYFDVIQLASAMELSQLLEHYHSQLVQAGWQLNTSGQNGSVAWSTWILQDKEQASWSGGLMLQHIGRKPVYTLTLYIRRDIIKRPEEAWFFWGKPPVFDES